MEPALRKRDDLKYDVRGAGREVLLSMPNLSAIYLNESIVQGTHPSIPFPFPSSQLRRQQLDNLQRHIRASEQSQ